MCPCCDLCSIEMDKTDAPKKAEQGVIIVAKLYKLLLLLLHSARHFPSTVQLQQLEQRSWWLLTAQAAVYSRLVSNVAPYCDHLTRQIICIWFNMWLWMNIEQPVVAVVCTSWHSVSLAARCTLFPENPLAWRNPIPQSALVIAQNLSFTLGMSCNVWYLE